MKSRSLALVLGFVVLMGVVVGGCLGGSGGATSTTSATQATGGSFPTGTTEALTTSHPDTATTFSQTISSSSENPTTTSSTESPTTSTTQTPVEEAYWEHPWEYAPINIDGELYLITYYKYDYKVQPNQSAPVYEYIVEKSVEKTKVHVYGQDMQMNRVDLGEQEVYAYKTVVTPVKAEGMEDTLTFTIWFVSNQSGAFLYPWDVLWVSYVSPTGSGGDFVGMRFEYKGSSFIFMNPAPFQSGLFPYFEGDQEIFEELNDDLVNLYIGWEATLHFGIWYTWGDSNVLIPQSGVWSDMQGHSWEWSTTPDGIATYGGKTFKLVDFQWKYEGTPEGVAMDGKGKFSPHLPLLVEGDGHYSYSDPQTAESTIIYAYFRLEDIKLEKVNL